MFLSVGCEDTKTARQEDELKELRAQNLAMEAQLAERDAAVSDMIATFDDIEQNLVEIKEMEKILSAEAESGIERDRKAAIIADIKTLHALLQESRDKIAALDKKLSSSNYQLSVFQKKLDELTAQLNERDENLLALTQELENRDLHIADLVTRVDTLIINTSMQKAVIDQQDRDLHTAYYATGTSKELKDKGLITAQGGVLGVGKSYSMSPEVVDEYFAEIDIREMTEVPVFAKKATLLTEHPVNSYHFVRVGDVLETLEITDPSEFWKTSRYLVMEVKGVTQEYATR